MTATAAIPAEMSLAPGENVIYTNQFSASNLLFFLKNRVALTDKRIAGTSPNTILGLIPAGSNKLSYPLSSVAGVATSTRFSTMTLLVGLVLLIGGFAVNILISLLGVVLIANAVKATFIVTNNAGQHMGHTMAIWDRSKAQDLANHINTALAFRG